MSKTNDTIVNTEKFNMLSKRQKQVVLHVALGESNNEIAQALFISPQTVKNHLYQICNDVYGEYNVSTRADLIFLLFLDGKIKPLLNQLGY
jgi:DNA-binding NarL/FixJ family response regulator